VGWQEGHYLTRDDGGVCNNAQKVVEQRLC